MWGQVCGQGASLGPHVHKEVLPKSNPENQKEQKKEHEKKSRYFLGGIQCRRYLLGGMYYRRYLLGGIQWWRYLLGGIESWRYSFGGTESWRYFFAEAIKPKKGGIFPVVMQYGSNVLVVGGFSFLAVTTLAVGDITKNGGKPSYHRDRPPRR